MRGMLTHVYTRIYFADEAEANAVDPVLSSVEDARRRTLIAARETTPAGTVYRLDLHMQGPDETVFFDV
jgi:protocatechuate 3,4-dioxygenase alpha subunit